MESLEQIAEEVRTCTQCRLHSLRTNAVPGEGNSTSQLLFIGEGPGKTEDEMGRPFVGAAGKFLDQLLASINLTRSDVFIANVVKCRPPENREPEPDEKTTCFPYLERQIHILKPKLIVLLGRHALDVFIPGLKISEAHGQTKIYKGIYSPKQAYLALYHPAAALYNSNLKTTLMSDFKKIPKILEKIAKLEY